jgi:hypothetical protein
MKDKELKTPLRLASKEGKDVESTDKKCCGSNNHVIIKLQDK